MELAGTLTHLLCCCLSHKLLLLKNHILLLQNQDLLLQLKVNLREVNRLILKPLNVLLELDYSPVSLVHELLLVQLLLKLVHVPRDLPHVILVAVDEVHLLLANHTIQVLLHRIDEAIELEVVPLELQIRIRDQPQPKWVFLLRLLVD